MQNDPELNPKFMGAISSDFIKVSDLLKEASYMLRQRKISKYPIFPMAKEELPLGAMLYEMGKFQNNWHYYISYAEELKERGLIENLQSWQSVYKDPDEYCCLFIVQPDFTNFIFIPFPTE